MRFLIITTFLFLGFLSHVNGQQRRLKNDFTAPPISQELKVQLDLLKLELNESDWLKSSKKRQFRCSFLMLNNLAKAASAINQKEAFECINSSLGYHSDEIENRNREFIKMTEKTFGIGEIALKKG